ncbi:hypothetical protein BDW66DRAFT_130121 [Aspergillus desertorum]
MLDIDRYVPVTSHRSRSPRRRLRSPERTDERSRGFVEIDRYMPGGGDRDRARDGQVQNQTPKAQSWRPGDADEKAPT